MMLNKKIAVLGGGSWATAIVSILSTNVDELVWCMRNESAVQHIKQTQHNPNYLVGVSINTDKISVSSDFKTTCEHADVIILAIPSAFLHAALGALDLDLSKKIFFSAVKGIIPEYNQIVGEYIQNQYKVPLHQIGVITGPCHAEEVALERLSYLTVACQDNLVAEFMSNQLRCNFIKVITSDDIYGTEYSAVLKNVVAVAAGIAHGLGYGDNFLSVLISNAIREIQRFLDVVHPINRDIKDSAYLGDLLVTAYSKFSRNRTFGTYIGKGYSVRAAQLDMNMIAEGYYAVKSIHEINKQHGVLMPITDAVYHIVYEKTSPRLRFKQLSDQLD
ncbi:NAD(P)H-dependent glycerol-3-phosphate dehydrogenase [Flavobacteriales bacterium]|nr:NAD(P)H-dependent glycerol-3-phosphate dehydrogenase [Flavobacteriales bacterium]MDG1145767.1 NAD(P)H-dependent glycerol-3-phosphate dehydrogenase [Flavobacteriales bacterium]MDG1395591.1 NAD(P)H-dependent glycerol-3-phosphate dehydrogenase [Flavobacteriales bacterium]